MIKIENPSKVQNQKRVDKKKLSAESGGGFSEIMDSLEVVEATQTSSVSAASSLSPIHSLDMILSVQGANEEVMRRQKQIKKATLTLDGLEDLRRALLIGSVPAYLLQTIETRMSVMRQEAMLPELRDIIEEIELRAAVELAKFKMQRWGKGAWSFLPPHLNARYARG